MLAFIISVIITGILLVFGVYKNTISNRVELDKIYKGVNNSSSLINTQTDSWNQFVDTNYGYSYFYDSSWEINDMRNDFGDEIIFSNRYLINSKTGTFKEVVLSVSCFKLKLNEFLILRNEKGDGFKNEEDFSLDSYKGVKRDLFKFNDDESDKVNVVVGVENNTCSIVYIKADWNQKLLNSFNFN